MRILFGCCRIGSCPDRPIAERGKVGRTFLPLFHAYIVFQFITSEEYLGATTTPSAPPSTISWQRFLFLETIQYQKKNGNKSIKYSDLGNLNCPNLLKNALKSHKQNNKKRLAKNLHLQVNIRKKLPAAVIDFAY